MDDPEQTDRLRREQRRRARQEAAEAERAPEPAEAEQHQRRAEKASYLEEKLAERNSTRRS